MTKEISVLARYCQRSQDSKSGQESIGRYELHELVQMDNSKSACTMPRVSMTHLQRGVHRAH